MKLTANSLAIRYWHPRDVLSTIHEIVKKYHKNSRFQKEIKLSGKQEDRGEEAVKGGPRKESNFQQK